jgi:hypothetical protein
MNRARLKKLRDHLAAFKPTENLKFNMGHWGYQTFKAPVVEAKATVKNGVVCAADIQMLEEGFCKTSACALGHAAMIPAFQRQGLKLVWNGTPEDLVKRSQELKKIGDSGVASQSADIMFAGAEGVDAGAEFFELSSNQASELFGGELQTKTEVVKYIDDLLAGKVDRHGQRYRTKAQARRADLDN